VFGCEFSSLKFREKRRLTECENRVLRGVFELKRVELTGGWTKLYSDFLSYMNTAQNIFSGDRVKKTDWSCSCFGYMGEGRRIQVYGGKL
jgi:hypothetical protein